MTDDLKTTATRRWAVLAPVTVMVSVPLVLIMTLPIPNAWLVFLYALAFGGGALGIWELGGLPFVKRAAASLLVPVAGYAGLVLWVNLALYTGELDQAGSTLVIAFAVLPMFVVSALAARRSGASIVGLSILWIVAVAVVAGSRPLALALGGDHLIADILVLAPGLALGMWIALGVLSGTSRALAGRPGHAGDSTGGPVADMPQEPVDGSKTDPPAKGESG